MNLETKSKRNKGFLGRKVILSVFLFSMLLSLAGFLTISEEQPMRAQAQQDPLSDECQHLEDLKQAAAASSQEYGEQIVTVKASGPRVDIGSQWERIWINQSQGIYNPDSQNYIVTLYIECVEGDDDEYIVEWTKDGVALTDDDYDFRFRETNVPMGSQPEFVPTLYRKNSDGTKGAQIQLSGEGVNTGLITDTSPSAQSNEIGGLGRFLARLMIGLLKLLAGAINMIFNLIVAPIIEMILKIEVHKFEFTEVILPVWLVIRNLMNIFFMLALIAVALSTLFRLNEKWNYKNVLVDIAVMALLINFSLTIAQAILGIAQTIQAQFLPANSDVIKVLAAQLMVEPFRTLNQGLTSDDGSVSAVVVAFVYFFLSITAFMTFLAVAAFLLVRVVALWLLLMISPIAYGLYVLPSTAKYAKEWWSNFLKYAFFTPLLGLALNICAILAKSQAVYMNETMNLPAAFIGAPVNPATGVTSNTLDVSFMTMIVNILSSVLIVGCLFMALKITTNLGIAGSGMIINKTQGLARKGGMWALRGAYRGTVGATAGKVMSAKRNLSAKYLANGDKGVKGSLKRLAFTAINPGVSMKQYSERNKKKEHDALHRAEAAASRIGTLRQTSGRVDTKKNLHIDAHIDDENKQHFEIMNSREKAETFKSFQGMLTRGSFGVGGRNSGEVNSQMRKLVLTAFQQGQLDDMIKLSLGMGENDVITDEKKDQFFHQLFGNDHTAQHAFLEESIEASAKKEGKIGYVGLAEGSPKKRHEKRLQYVRDMSGEQVAKMDIGGVFDSKHILDDKNPKYKDETELYREVLNKVKDQEKISKKVATQLAGSKRIDAKDGHAIAQNQTEAKRFVKMRQDDPDLYVAVHNALMGVYDQNNPNWVEEEKIPDVYWEQKADKKADPSKIFDIDGRELTDIDPKRGVAPAGTRPSKLKHMAGGQKIDIESGGDSGVAPRGGGSGGNVEGYTRRKSGLYTPNNGPIGGSSGK